MEFYCYKVKSIDRVVDGDTVDMTLDTGFSNRFSHRFRLTGYDAPESWRPKTDAEAEGGKQVTEKLIEILNKHKDKLYARSNTLGIYGRYEAAIYYLDGGNEININKEIWNWIIENKLTKEDLR